MAQPHAKRHAWIVYSILESLVTVDPLGERLCFHLLARWEELKLEKNSCYDLLPRSVLRKEIQGRSRRSFVEKRNSSNPPVSKKQTALICLDGNFPNSYPTISNLSRLYDISISLFCLLVYVG